jgi:hypothetical protein
MDRAGMSMALGAFLMGMMLSTSRYSLQIEATLEPHKGLLMSLFFVAVGMSVDVATLAQHPFEFALHVVAVITIKVDWCSTCCACLRTGRSTALRVAFMLSQGGEFGFVVFGSAKALGVIDDLIFVMAVAVISLTMLLTPLLVKLGNRLAVRAEDGAAGADERIRHATQDDDDAPRVVIGGYGRVGHTVGTILASSGISYVAFDTDAVLVARWRGEGHPVFYGDIGNPELLGNARTAPGRSGSADDRRPARCGARRNADPLARAGREDRRARPRPEHLRRPAAGRRQPGLPRNARGQPAPGSGGLEALGISTTTPTCCCAACAAPTMRWYAGPEAEASVRASSEPQA